MFILRNQPKVQTKTYLVFFILLFSLSFSQTYIPDTRVEMSVNGHLLTLPYLSNHDLYILNYQTKLAVISIHGDSRNGDSHYDVLRSVAQEQSLIDSTVIIAPFFLTQDHLGLFQLDSTCLYFSTSNWNAGYKSRTTGENPRPEKISSFSVLDTIITALIDNNPNLNKIVMAGHSAGSQMVVRYAAGNHLTKNLEIPEAIDIQYVPINTSSFLYMDNARVVDEDADDLQFEPPSDCYTHNYYKYGLDNLPQYMVETGVEQIRSQYFDTRVIYLVGEYDGSGYTGSCNRDTQGSNIYKRTHNYFSYLEYFYDENVYAKHSMGIVPGVGHNYDQSVQSECGKKAIFGIGDCDEIEAKNKKLRISLKLCEPDTAETVTISSPAWSWQTGLDIVASQDPNNDSLWSVIIEPPPSQSLEYLWKVNGQKEDLILFDELTNEWLGHCVGSTDSSSYAYRLWSPDSSHFISQEYGTCSRCEVTLAIYERETINEHTKEIRSYPNPFNNQTIITFFIDEPGDYSVNIYNLIGKSIFTKSKTFEGDKEVSFVIDFNTKKVSSGVYYYHIQSDNFLKKGKLLFLK
tara:strand:+ start:172 stop:1893 length:1722 start_codon:yes stop_codon:yes gene_type:complete